MRVKQRANEVNLAAMFAFAAKATAIPTQGDETQTANVSENASFRPPLPKQVRLLSVCVLLAVFAHLGMHQLAQNNCEVVTLCFVVSRLFSSLPKEFSTIFTLTYRLFCKLFGL